MFVESAAGPNIERIGAAANAFSGLSAAGLEDARPACPAGELVQQQVAGGFPRDEPARTRRDAQPCS